MGQKWSPEQHAKYKATWAAKREKIASKRKVKVYSNKLAPAVLPAVTVAESELDDGYKQAVRDLLPLLERLTR